MKHYRDEIIKCVVVGDTAVGKTRLIHAKACNIYLSVTQLLTVHVPTVWAVDHYRMHQEWLQVLRRSWNKVDDVNVSLRLWDTFGNHDNNRLYAYGRADVIVLCFSIANPQSLRNCKTIWCPEIRKNCPHTPIILVGCQNDWRHMYQDDNFLALYRNKKYCIRLPKESDLITREQGRALASELGTSYYEVSVLTRYGVEDAFENAIRRALLRRRQQRFWPKSLRSVQLPFLQKPYCPPCPPLPKIKVKPSTYENEMAKLLDQENYTDVRISTCGDVVFHAHTYILAAASLYFRNLFQIMSTGTHQENSVHTITIFQGFSPPTVSDYLKFLYCGYIKIADSVNLFELMEIAILTNDENFQVFLNSIHDNEMKNREVQLQHVENLKNNIKEICLNRNMGADVSFKLNDGICSASRAILMARCDVMAAMFGGNFLESSAKIVPFPGITTECFKYLLVYLYTDTFDANLCISDCLPLLELSNRLCLFRLISLIEDYMISLLSKETNTELGYEIEDICHLLEPSQKMNAHQLAGWCQYFITINYQQLSTNAVKNLRILSPENQAYLNKNRWPPASYLKELDYYERYVQEKKKEKTERFFQWKQTDNIDGCFCLQKRNKKHLKTIEETPASLKLLHFLKT